MPSKARQIEFAHGVSVAGPSTAAAAAAVDKKNNIRDLQMLMRQQDSEYLSRYPSFYPTTSTDVPQPLADSPSAPRKHRRHHSGQQAHFEDDHHFAEIPESHKVSSSDPEGRSWYSPERNSLHPSSNRRHPPTRAAPHPPVDTPLSHVPTISTSLAEPTQPFPRVMKPRKSALKKPAPSRPSHHHHQQQPTFARLPAPSQFLPVPRPDLVPSSSPMSNGGSLLHPGFALSPPATESNLSRASKGSTLFSTPSVPPSTFGSSSTSHGSSVGYSLPSESGSPQSIQHPLPSPYPLRPTNPDPDSDDCKPAAKKKAPPPPVPVRSNLKRRPTIEFGAPPVPPLPAQFAKVPQPTRSEEETKSSPHFKPSSPRSPPKTPNTAKTNGTFTLPTARKPPPPPPSESGTESSVDSPPTSPRRASRDVNENTIPKEWVYPLPLTLEQLFHGGSHQFRITQHMLDGTTKMQKVHVEVQPGWKTGTRVVFPGAGNQRVDKSFQDVVFVVEQLHHDRFARLDGGRLVLNLDMELAEALKGKGRAPRRIKGLDGRTVEFHPPPGIIKNGMQTILPARGMPIRSKSKVVGRGDLIINWNVRIPDDMPSNQVEAMRRLVNHT
ncbi:hypothetical protein FRC02_008188 [Tulasnella sp. 418]|nr:hypothetical protein FRC02_008188 [Tulasnella sp. 418]